MWLKFLENNPYLYLLPIMTQASHPRQNGILWVTIEENADREKNQDSKENEDPVKTNVSQSMFKTPDKVSRNDDTLTMHTMDVVSNLRRSIIEPNRSSKIIDTTLKKLQDKSELERS